MLMSKMRWVVFSVIGFLSSANGMHDFYRSKMPIASPAACLGLGISALGLIFIIYAAIILQRSVQSPAELVTSGPYGLVRNPAYLGGILINLGLMIAAGSVAIIGGGRAVELVQLILFCAGGIGSYWLAALMEERYNINRFGEPYKRYAKEVPRLDLIRGWRQFSKQRGTGK